MLPATVLYGFPDLPLRFAPRGHRNGTNYSSLCHLPRANLGKTGNRLAPRLLNPCEVNPYAFIGILAVMICYAKFKCNSHPDPDQRFHFHKLECPRSQAFLQLILGSNLEGRKVHEATLNGHFTPLTTKDFWKCTLGGFPSKEWTMPPWTLLTPSTFWRNLCCA